MSNYRAAEGLSGSQLGLLAECPVKFKYKLENPTEPTEAMLKGTLCHEALLEPHVISQRYAVMRDDINYKRNTNEGKANYAALEATGKPLMHECDINEALEMAKIARVNPIVSELLSCSPLIEHEMYWNELEVECKGKIDLYCPKLNVLVDYKTSSDISPNKFKWTIKDYGYLLQLAHYQTGLKTTLGLESLPGVLIIAQETSAPYVCQVYSVKQEDIDSVHAVRRNVLEEYKNSYASGVWRGYSSEVLEL